MYTKQTLEPIIQIPFDNIRDQLLLRCLASTVMSVMLLLTLWRTIAM